MHTSSNPPDASSNRGQPEIQSNDFEKALPDPFQILGLRLLPLSIGRYRILKRLDCAFVSEGEASATIEDLVVGVLVCSMTCEEFLEQLGSKKFEREIRRWSRFIKATPPFWMTAPIIGRLLSRSPLGRLWRSRHSFNYFEKMQLFQRYIQEAQALPHFIPLNPSMRDSLSHWSTNVEIVLRSQVGWSREEINEEPLSKALGDYFKHCENEGLIIIMTEEDLSVGEDNSAALEEFAKKNPGILSTLNSESGT